MMQRHTGNLARSFPSNDTQPRAACRRSANTSAVRHAASVRHAAAVWHAAITWYADTPEHLTRRAAAHHLSAPRRRGAASCRFKERHITTCTSAGGTIQPHGDAEHSDSGPQTTGRCNPLPHAWMTKARQRITPHLLPWQCSGLPLPAATTPPPWRTSNPTATKLAMVAPTLCSRLVAPVKYLSHPLSLTAG